MAKDPLSFLPFAELVQEGHAARLWQGQSLSLETHQMFAYLAGRGFDIPVGTSVVLMPMRHAFEAAVQARSLSRLTGRRTVLGVGPGAPDFTAELRGEPYTSPRTACIDYLDATRHFLGQSEAFPSGGQRGAAPLLPGLEHPGVELGLGVLRPVLARAAGMAADAAISWMTPPGYVADVLLPAMAKGAAERGRPVPRMVTVVHAALAGPGRDPYQLALAAARAHLSTAHYTDMLRQAGLRLHPSQPYLGARALVDSGTFLYGSAEEIHAGLREYEVAGVDEVVLNLSGVAATYGYGAAAEDLRRILTRSGCRTADRTE
ncbi:LLM class flavin-dependent oxidoreductase [Streptomyces sp. 549]|uniref:LLM class flavin-dependent oxidoreductase n=1 Tax=Streptomyces sp. 549 TaxID=3049076 RepID=UPI0024C2E2F4|nr:LLM class flavin-dependent oxidoreductase [Streptomyces sp. 549]MDK1473097.1 LLM class flavin-dependent oxidoreductase [Streptomyces sp. 549]